MAPVLQKPLIPNSRVKTPSAVKVKNPLSTLAYVVFDLEISAATDDNLRINQFAYRKNNETFVFNGEEELMRLADALSNSPIVVGHNIKQWDLPILAVKNIRCDAFIWDTLEMELLLSPLRYAYSLRAKHKAKEDAELTEKIFWNQLERLSRYPELCNQLKNFLPDSINNLLATWPKATTTQIVNIDTQFFNERLTLDPQIIKKLKEIDSNANCKDTLIIAPRVLWPALCLYLHLSFPYSEEEQYYVIRRERLLANPLPNAFSQMILLRFCDQSPTPLAANLAPYLRIAGGYSKISFTDEVLAEYLDICDGKIDCIDIDAFGSIRAENYKRIYIIGNNLRDLYKIKIGPNLTLKELSERSGQIALRMSAANCVNLPEKDVESLGLRKSSLVENTWLERLHNGEFAIYQSYNNQKYFYKFLKHSKAEYIEWQYRGQWNKYLCPLIARCAPGLAFNAKTKRVTTETVYRSRYWACQIAMLMEISRKHPLLPLIYIVDSAEEIESLEKYARALGFYVPEYGSGFRKLEYIGKRRKGLIIVSKKQFLGCIGSYRTDRPFCYVWDNLNIELYKAAWKNLPVYEAHEKESGEKTKGITARECIIRLWPLYQHYYSLIKANNDQSLLYLLDYYFDDYPDLPKVCKTKVEDLFLWATEEEYAKALRLASEFIKDRQSEAEPLDTVYAMEKIRQIFLNEHHWTEEQKKILPHMLEKRGDCVISIPTGGGKSVLFQGPAIYRGALSKKLTLVIEPLRALMQDQVEELNHKGFSHCVDYLNADRLYSETQQIYRRIRGGAISVLYITPERLRIKPFQAALKERMEKDGGLEYIIFDEAHCITQWGNEFRPEYRGAFNTCSKLKKSYKFMIALFSATITAQEERDFRLCLPDLARLGQQSDDYNPVRQHINISFHLCDEKTQNRLNVIYDNIVTSKIDFLKSRMLIFCRTRRDCEETAHALQSMFEQAETEELRGYASHIDYFHAGMPQSERNKIYQRFKNNGEDRLFILCSTKAFGMGMDIPNIHYLLHYSPPSVFEDYLQEVGRAGRDKKMYELAFPGGEKIPATCFCSPEDFKKLKLLLLKSQLSWSDISEANTKIIEYIRKFRSLEKAREIPVVLPYDVWSKETGQPHESSLTQIIFNWLERMKRLRLRFAQPAHINLTVENIATSNFIILAPYIPLYQYILAKIPTKGQLAQLSIQDMREALSLTLPDLIDGLLVLVAHNLITIHQTIYCDFQDQRNYETLYALKHNEDLLCLHIIISCVRSLLQLCKINQKFEINNENYRQVINLPLKNAIDEIRSGYVYTQESQKNSVKTREDFMIWKREFEESIGKPRIKTILKFERFAKLIMERGRHWIFQIIDIIPDIILKDDKTEQTVITRSLDWQTFLEDFEADCWEFVNFLNINAAEYHDRYNWFSLMLNLGYCRPKKGYKYFQDVLSILRLMGYIDHSPLLPGGVEAFTTEKTGDKFDDGLEEESPLFKFRREFEELEFIKKTRLACMNVFSLLQTSEATSASRLKLQGNFIHRYFQCASSKDYIKIIEDFAPADHIENLLSELKEEALITAEQGLNKEQKTAYFMPKTAHINIQAGPGSGKTHLLTLRCAWLVYREKVDPSHILALAYNRAVAVELRNRLDHIFSGLGLSKLAFRLNVHTFHSFAKRCLGKALENIPVEKWEEVFLKFICNEPGSFKTIFPLIKYILVDEFQDVTQTRLDCLLALHAIFPESRFFTIGDINQSIYGYERAANQKNISPIEYARLIDPRPYYTQIVNALNPVNLNLSINYRSYQKILDAASVYIQDKNMLPRSAAELMTQEPEEEYVKVTDNLTDTNAKWYLELVKTIQAIKTKNQDDGIKEIAVLFRSNIEVYQGFNRIKDRIEGDVRIRILGAEICGYWRKKEVFAILQILEAYKTCTIIDNQLPVGVKQQIFDMRANWLKSKWITDDFYIEVIYAIMLDFLNTLSADGETRQVADLIDYIKDVTENHDGQIFKIYDHYIEERPFRRRQSITITLSTIHKIKGREFDAVFLPPSNEPLPVNLKDFSDINEGLLASLEEERRLRFVACTRAKKYLHLFIWHREQALDKNKHYVPAKLVNYYVEKKPGLENYYLSFNAIPNNYVNNVFILKFVKQNDPVTLKINNNSCNIYCRDHIVGSLSNNSSIKKLMMRNGKKELTGFYVRDIIVWTYEETVKEDEKKGQSFAKLWSEKAKGDGYVYVVDIGGFGT